MEGTLIASYRCGVRVYDLGYCISECGRDSPLKCPDALTCARYQVYTVRWNHDGSYEWRQTAAGTSRTQAFKMAAERADSEEHFAAFDANFRKFIDAARL